MPTVDENESQSGAPVSRDRGRVAHYGDHHRLQPGGSDRAPEGGQGVEAAVLTHQPGVEVLLAGLLLFRAAVMVHAEQDRAPLTGRSPQVDGGAPAVGAHL